MDEFADESIPQDEPVKKRRGRPPGVKNRPKDSILTSEKLAQLYDRVSPYLTPEQKKYTKGVINGGAEVDCRREMELLVRQMSILFSEAAIWHFNNQKISQDLAKFADSYRQATKDLYEIQRQEEVKVEKQQAHDDLVSLTDGGTALDRLKDLPGFSTE